MIDVWERAKRVRGYLSALGGVAFATLLLAPFQGNINSTTAALALLLVVLVVATVFGSRSALLASVLGVLSFNFFFLPPLYTLTIADPQNWFAFAAFLVTAVVAGQLSSYARRRADESEARRREIERLYSELQAAFKQGSQAEAFRQGEQLKSALLDAVTHDLRTPLTSIKASVTTLMEDSIVLDQDARSEFLEIIDEETDRLNKFIGGMVDLARLEAGKSSLRKTWSEVEEIIGNAIERARTSLTNHHIIVEIEREMPAVRVDAASIEEVIYTLLDNAAKYSPDTSDIRIKARRGANETVEISVEDKGSGIPLDMRERVFDKFFRASAADDANSTSSGLGLGLAIARGVTESQDGRIWIEDGRDGFVTRVVFTIPVGDDEVDTDSTA